KEGQQHQTETPYPTGAFDYAAGGGRDCVIARRFGSGARPQGREKRIEGGTQRQKRNRESGFERRKGAKERGSQGFEEGEEGRQERSEGGEEGFEGGQESGFERRKGA